MRSCHVLDYGQSQAGPAKLARARAVHTVESFKQTIQVVLRNSFTSILDANLIVFDN